MAQKILFFDPDSIGEEEHTKKLMGNILGFPVIQFKIVTTIDLFLSLLSQDQWTTIIINFQTTYWNSLPTDIEHLLEQLPGKYPESCRLVAITARPEEKVLVEGYGFKVACKKYTLTSLSEAFEVSVPKFTGVSVENIATLVSDYFKINLDDVRKTGRKRENTQARQISMRLAKMFTHDSLYLIGEYFNGRDHTTVIHANQTVKDLCDTDPLFKQNFDELVELVKLTYSVPIGARA